MPITLFAPGWVWRVFRDILLVADRPPTPDFVVLPDDVHPEWPVHKPVSILNEFDRLTRTSGGYYRTSFTLLYLSAIAAIIFAVLPIGLDTFVHDGRLRHFLDGASPMAELVAIGAVGIFYFRARRYHRKWIDLRGVTEYARYSPLFLLDSSLLDHLPEDRNHSHRKKIDALRRELYERSLDEAFIKSEAFRSAYHTFALRLAREQCNYHKLNAAREKTLTRRIHFLTVMLFGGTVIAVMAHIFVHTGIMTFAATVLPAFGTALHGFLAQGETERLAHRFSQMHANLKRIAEELSAITPQAQELHMLGLRLADLLMVEVRDWRELVSLQEPHLG